MLKPAELYAHTHTNSCCRAFFSIILSCVCFFAFSVPVRADDFNNLKSDCERIVTAYNNRLAQLNNQSSGLQGNATKDSSGNGSRQGVGAKNAGKPKSNGVQGGKPKEKGEEKKECPKAEDVNMRIQSCLGVYDGDKATKKGIRNTSMMMEACKGEYPDVRDWTTIDNGWQLKHLGTIAQLAQEVGLIVNTNDCEITINGETYKMYDYALGGTESAINKLKELKKRKEACEKRSKTNEWKNGECVQRNNTEPAK